MGDKKVVVVLVGKFQWEVFCMIVELLDSVEKSLLCRGEQGKGSQKEGKGKDC